jgi:hypothetical protein
VSYNGVIGKENGGISNLREEIDEVCIVMMKP